MPFWLPNFIRLFLIVAHDYYVLGVISCLTHNKFGLLVCVRIDLLALVVYNSRLILNIYSLYWICNRNSSHALHTIKIQFLSLRRGRFKTFNLWRRQLFTPYLRFLQPWSNSDLKTPIHTYPGVNSFTWKWLPPILKSKNNEITLWGTTKGYYKSAKKYQKWKGYSKLFIFTMSLPAGKQEL